MKRIFNVLFFIAFFFVLVFLLFTAYHSNKHYYYNKLDTVCSVVCDVSRDSLDVGINSIPVFLGSKIISLTCYSDEIQNYSILPFEDILIECEVGSQ